MKAFPPYRYLDVSRDGFRRWRLGISQQGSWFYLLFCRVIAVQLPTSETCSCPNWVIDEVAGSLEFVFDAVVRKIRVATEQMKQVIRAHLSCL